MPTIDRLKTQQQKGESTDQLKAMIDSLESQKLALEKMKDAAKQ